MTTHAALLAAVLAAPDDDTVRKAFADYCRENGQEERADFIEVQLELERIDPKRTVFYLPDPEEKPELPPLHQREQDLWAAAVESDEVFDWFRGVFEHAFTSMAGVAQLSAGSGPDDYNQAGAQAIIRRGFVSEIHCTLAEWCGGEQCLTCGGGGHDPYRAYESERGTCPECCGTGRTPGIGPAVVRSHPVTSVRLTDRDPVFGASPNFRWTDASDPNPLYSFRSHPQNQLPPDMFRLVTGNMTVPNQSPYIKWFATEEDALKALSAALILWAKQQNNPKAAFALSEMWG